MPKRDWIDEMNSLADTTTPKQDDRQILEDMIMWLSKTKLGPRFVAWYRGAVGQPIDNIEARHAEEIIVR